MKKTNLKIVSLLMTAILSLNSVEMVSAMNNYDENVELAQQSQNETIDMTKITDNEIVNDYILSALMYGESINKLENQYNIDIDEIKSNSVFQNEEYVEKLLSDYEEYFNSNSTQYTLNIPKIQLLDNSDIEILNAKKVAMTYSMQMAEISVNRNKLSGDAIGKEAQYMFLSHYIDRNSYYWGDKDSNKLLDGATMSGINGILADWITDNDRVVYDSYIELSNTKDTITSYADAYLFFRSFNYDDLSKIDEYTKNIEETNNNLEKVAYLLDYYRTYYDNTEELRDEIIPFFLQELEKQLSFGNTDNSIEKSVMAIADNYNYSVDGLDDVIVVENIFKFILNTSIDVLTTDPKVLIVEKLVEFGVEKTDNLFDYVAWVGMIQSLNGRRSARMWAYYLG